MQELIEIIKIGGPSVATAALFLWYIDRMDKRMNELVSNHFQHISDAIEGNTKVLSALTVLIKDVKGDRGKRGPRGLRGR